MAAMTKIWPATPATLEDAAQLIHAGKLVAFGTETVYGLGGNANDGEAVARIFAAKGRPSFNPLISHVPDAIAAFQLGASTRLAAQLAEAFWPGPMSLVLAQQPDCTVSPLATSGLNSIALRVPASAEARQFLSAVRTPVAAPSANRSGRISPTRATHVADELNDAPELALILDTGPCTAGLESTVIDARGEVPVILRPGSITAAMIAEATGVEPGLPSGKIISPGQMESHYAPSVPVILDQLDAAPDIAFIGFGDTIAPAAKANFNLSPGGDLIEAAALLYQLLREADASGARAIAVAPVPAQGIGAAINDRLARAAKGSTGSKH